MAISMHNLTVPMFTMTLTSLIKILGKAEEQCPDLSIAPKDLVEKKLADDMFNLTQQIQRATFHCFQAGAKLTGIDTPEIAENETSIAALQQRLQKTIDFLGALNPADFDGSDEKVVEIKTRIKVLNLTGQDFLQHIAIPQVMFHVTTAYDIIRNAGIEIGKKDLLGESMTR
jgi:uncharacterized protein